MVIELVENNLTIFVMIIFYEFLGPVKVDLVLEKLKMCQLNPLLT